MLSHNLSISRNSVGCHCNKAYSPSSALVFLAKKNCCFLKLNGDKMYRSVKTAIHVLCELKQPVVSKRRKQTMGMLRTTYPNDYVEIMVSMPPTGSQQRDNLHSDINTFDSLFRRRPCRWRLLRLSCLGVWCSPELSAHRRRYSRFFCNLRWAHYFRRLCRERRRCPLETRAHFSYPPVSNTLLDYWHPFISWTLIVSWQFLRPASRRFRSFIPTAQDWLCMVMDCTT